MRQYIAFLRGINGGLTLKMAELRKLFETLGFTNIQTVLATGNVIFEASQSNQMEIASQIEQAIASAYNYETVAILYTRDKLGELFEANPFHSIRRLNCRLGRIHFAIRKIRKGQIFKGN